MANVELKRGQQTQVDVTFITEGATDAFDFSSGYTATLIIRRKAGNSFNGDKIDTLISAGSGTGANRITFTYTAAGPNIQLKWSTVQSSALPNEATTVYGDLKVTLTSDSQVKHSFRIPFDLVPEIT